MNAPKRLAQEIADPLLIAGRAYRSRLLIGTGKYRDFDETRRVVEASGSEIVTVAIRRTNIGRNAGEPSLLEVLPPTRYTILPNTAGCYSSEDAVRMNTAVAKAQNPVLMAQAMKKAVEAGREAFLAGRMPKKLYSASSSSPASGLISPKAA